MATTSGGDSFGAATTSVTPGASALNFVLPEYTSVLLLRCPSTNAGNVYVKIGNLTATTSDLLIRPGENVQLDLSQLLYLRMIMQGSTLDKDDFPRSLSYVADNAGETLYIDAFSVI